MSSIAFLGKVDYLNCFPIYYPLEKAIISAPCEIKKGPPAFLNKKFIHNELNITPISSIEYANNWRKCQVITDLSISAEGKVMSILLFSKYKLEDLNNLSIAVTTSSATSVVLLKILLRKLGIKASCVPQKPNISEMLAGHPAALLIGDDALQVQMQTQNYFVYDLGELWFHLTSLPMVYALWVVNNNMTNVPPEVISETINGLKQAKKWQEQNAEFLKAQAVASYDYNHNIIDKYYETIQYDLDAKHLNGLLLFYQYAKEMGMLKEGYELNFWGDSV